ncbi:hypothetical protein EYW49_13745 [Siculibacillus lacustris]|uniref:CpsD/CapB family tyrosine-protein kinase n=1 Tax=Siculibacillus lacustris TaxID=1549641 RepID=A0A4Q9VPC2_9HYPH|nr:hypothetical protein EYW49_13745 [Siculibacillus lacustris]
MDRAAAAAVASVPRLRRPIPRRRDAPPQRVDLVLLPERLARLGRSSGPGTGADAALVETADGAADPAGLAILQRLDAALGGAEGPAARLLYADTVPTAVAAALVFGLARAVAEAGRRVVLFDLAEDAGPLAAAFDRAPRLAAPHPLRELADFDVHAEAHGVVLVRPTAAALDRPLGHLAAAVASAIDIALVDHDLALVHVGTAPAAALLFDVAEAVDRVVLIAEAGDLTGTRLAGEIEVMSGLLPQFDRILALALSGSEPAAPRGDRRRIRRS